MLHQSTASHDIPSMYVMLPQLMSDVLDRWQEVEEEHQRQLQAGRAAQEGLEQRLRQDSELRATAEADVARQRQCIQNMRADLAGKEHALQLAAAQVYNLCPPEDALQCTMVDTFKGVLSNVTLTLLSQNNCKRLALMQTCV